MEKTNAQIKESPCVSTIEEYNSPYDRIVNASGTCYSLHDVLPGHGKRLYIIVLTCEIGEKIFPTSIAIR